MKEDRMLPDRSLRLVLFTGYFVGISAFGWGVLQDGTLSGLTSLGLTLVLAPPMVFVLSKRKILPEILALGSLLFPLTLINYLYAIRIGYPVGFQDVHSHINEAQRILTSQGFIDFNKAQTVSFSFVGLYVITWFTEIVSNVGIVTVASLLPPAVDVLLALIVYLVGRRLFDARISILAVAFFAWDNNTILFGHEFRTQTLGTLFTITAILVYLGRGKASGRRLALAVCSIIFLFALTTSSFVSNVFAFVLLTGLMVFPKLLRRQTPLLGGSQYGLFLAFLALYILYISATTYGSPSAVVSSIVVLLREAFATSSAPTLSVGQEIYGPVVRVFTYGFWSLFAVLFVQVLRKRFGQPDTTSLSVLMSLLVTFTAGVGFSTFSVLSPGRAYAIGSILIGLVVAAGLVGLIRRSPTNQENKLKVVCFIVVVAFVAVSVAKFPTYLVTDVSPIRGHEIIDSVPYWRLSSRDDAIATFLLSHAQDKHLHLDVVIAPYMLLGVFEQGLVPAAPTYDKSGNLLKSNLQAGDLVLLRNRYEDSPYAFRDLLPPETAYSQMSLVYTDGDYQLYLFAP